MDESEVESAADAAYYLANEVIHEYHGMPLVHRADIGGARVIYLELNGHWYMFEASKVLDANTIENLETLSS